MGTNLVLRLKAGFRDPLRSGAGFVGREAELARLVAMFKHRSAATVLVSGHRGVGKTTLVDEALRQATKSKTVIARLGLPHINPEDGGASRELRGQILRSLARSLHFAVKDEKAVKKELRERTQALYDKTYLKELQEQGQLEALTQAEIKSTSAVKSETSFDPGKIVGALLGSVGAGIVATGGAATAAVVGRDHGLGWGVATLVFVAGAAIAGGVTTTRAKSEEKTSTEQVLDRHTAMKVGTFDLSPETLEFELKELLTALDALGVSPIFVVDELDKLEATPGGAEHEATLEGHVIFSILSSLKNFFTLGAGIFVFISGEDFYARLEESVANESYSLAHTIFTDRIFVHVLRWNDVEALIDNLLAQKPEDEDTYRKFRNYLCWESRNHAFDLLTRLGDYIESFDGDTPVLVAREAAGVDGHWHEGNLPNDWLLAAGLQKVVGATFDESVRPGGREERFNQALWLTLLDTAKELTASRSMVVPQDGFELEESRWSKHLSARDVDDLAGAVDRLLARAERYGLVTAEETVLEVERSKDEDNEAVEGASAEPENGSGGTPAIEYSIATEPPYPDASVGTHAAPSPFEKGFLQVATTLAEVHDHVVAAGLSTAGSQQTVQNTARLAANVSTRTERQAPPRSEIRQALGLADRLIPRLLVEGPRGIVNAWARDKGFDVADLTIAEADNEEATAASSEPDPETERKSFVSLREFEPLRPLLTRDPQRAMVVATEAVENQVLVLLMPPPELAEEIQKAYENAAAGQKGQERRVQRLPIVEVRQAPPDTPIQLPTEILTVTETDPTKGWAAWVTNLLRDPPTRERKVEATLAGWNVFHLHPTADNLKDLRATLDKVQYMAVASDEAD
jgi:Cdc6-like AAA superfamily ATPase